MPLVIQYNGSYAAPQILWGHCGMVISDARDGNSQWATSPIDEGIAVPNFLAHNLHVTWQECERKARLMSLCHARAPQPATPVIGFVSRTPSAPIHWPVTYTLILILCLTVRR
jgi:hypothetical protein